MRLWFYIFVYILILNDVYSTSRNEKLDEVRGGMNHRCNGEFFTLLADKMPWTADSESCLHSFNANRDRLRVLATSLLQMNSSLTIYTTLQDIPQCREMFVSLPNLLVKSFDAKELLREYGYYDPKVMDKMTSWKLTGYVRSSDIVRLTLAHKFNQIYLDSDVHLLDLDLSMYQIPFVAVNVWQDIENALEISNCAFCLPRDILSAMMRFQQNRIVTGSDSYHYTELGPSMFHKVLMNQPNAIALYSQNNPKAMELEAIAQSIKLYGHKFLHISTAIRKALPHWGIVKIVNTIRELAQLEPIRMPASSGSHLPSDSLVLGGRQNPQKRKKRSGVGAIAGQV